MDSRLRYCDAWSGLVLHTLQDGYFGPPWNPMHDRGQLFDLAMARRIAIEPRADFIIYDIGSKSKVVDVNCQDFPALAEAVILAACEQFDAKGGA